MNTNNVKEIENLIKLISKLPGLGPKSAKRIEYDKKNDAVRADSRAKGIKFSDSKGTGRIVKGKKRYD